jgi:hypothetical protein
MSESRTQAVFSDTDRTGLLDGNTLRLLRRALAYSRRQDYTGWDYGDGMSSRLLRALPVENTYLNLAVQEVVKRSPVEVRPFLMVERRRNYMGAALFAMAIRNYGSLNGEVEAVDRFHDIADPESETRSLLEWLLSNQCPGCSGFCGGHRHDLQHLNGRVGKPSDPDLVSTSYAVRALLANADLDDRYPETARTATAFVEQDLDYRTVPDGAVVNYHLNHDPDVYTINAGALGARLFLDLYDHFGTPVYRERAAALLDHVAGLQTDRGGWHYRDPPSSSHLSMDSHHNGFVIEGFQRYDEVVDDDRYAETIADGMAFYRSLFDSDGAPDFDESSPYPRDIHAATQGILVFTYAGEFERARRLIGWIVDNLYAGDGRFYFRKHRLYTQRITLMRWCQAWTAYALSEYLRISTTAPDRRRQVPTSGRTR